MAAGIADEAGQGELVEAQEARAEDAAGGFAEGAGEVTGVSWHIAAARAFRLGDLVQAWTAKLDEGETI